MPESVPVRCPACRRERLYVAPTYPCACGAPVAPALDRRTSPASVTHRAWEDDWITLRCASCDRRSQWPHPEFGCPCGTVLRMPVREREREREWEAGGLPETAGTPEATAEGAAWASDPAPVPTAGARRAAFHSVAIHTALDAVTATALYLRWLGHDDVRRADQRPTSGIGLAARGLLAQVDPSARPADRRDVECLWLTAMAESTDCVYFSLAGYTDDARTGADLLCVPLFLLDPTGTPRPVNRAAREVAADGT